MGDLKDILVILAGVAGILATAWYNSRRATQDDARVATLEKERTDLETKQRAAAQAEADRIVAAGDRHGAELFMDDSLRATADPVPSPKLADGTKP